MSSGNYLICEGWDVVEVTPELEVVWQFGKWGEEGHLKGAQMAWLYEGMGTVIVADTGNDRVLEVDKESSEVVKSLTVKCPVSAFLNPETGNVLVASKCEHCVRELTWEGEEVWRYGEPGRPGWEEGLLKEPWFAHPAKTSWLDGFDGALVADYGNHRILLVRRDGEVIRTALSTGPESAFQMGNFGLAATGQIVGYLADQDWHVRWFAPDNWRLSPTEEGTVILYDTVSAVEVDPWLLRPESVLPGCYRMATSLGVPAEKAAGPAMRKGADIPTLPPLPAFAIGALTIWVKATGRAIFRLLTAKVKWSWAPTVQFDGWEEFEEREVPRGRAVPIEMGGGHAFVSVEVRAEEDLKVDLWACWPS